jgi:probable phosphomutase (TIGR03848 family)
MPTLLLIRHGENDFLATQRLPGRLSGIHLNQEGRKQAAQLAQCLSKLPVRAIYSSPLERAVETAEPLAEALQLKISFRSDLTDIDPGDWTGRSIKSLRRFRLWKGIQETPSRFQFPHGETFVQAQARITKALDAIVMEHPDGLVAIFFHADPIKLAVTHYLGLPLDNFQRLSANPGSVTVLRMDGSTPRLLAANLIPPFSFPES